MIRGLSAEFHLAETFMSASCSFPNRFRKEFLGHKMGTGAGGKVAAVFDQFQSFDIDLAVTFDSVFGGLAGVGKCSNHMDGKNVKKITSVLLVLSGISLILKNL